MRIPRDRRNPGHRHAARRCLRATLRANAGAGGEFLRHRDGIQQKSGGNLSEALGNLSKVLRDRRKMAGKIQAMSMEAKASAAHHRLAAADRDAAGLHLDARLHLAAVDPADRPPDAGRLRGVDEHGHLRHETMINFDF